MVSGFAGVAGEAGSIADSGLWRTLLFEDQMHWRIQEAIGAMSPKRNCGLKFFLSEKSFTMVSLGEGGYTYFLFIYLY